MSQNPTVELNLMRVTILRSNTICCGSKSYNNTYNVAGQNPRTIIQFDVGQNPTTIIQYVAGQNPRV